jgi:hypothetical protein
MAKGPLQGVCGKTGGHFPGQGAVAADQAGGEVLSQGWATLHQFGNLSGKAVRIKVPARQRGFGGPGRSHIRQGRAQSLKDRFRQPSVGGDLSAVKSQQWCFPGATIQFQDVVAGSGLGVTFPVVKKWPDSGKGAYHLICGDWGEEIFAGGLAEIVYFTPADRDCGGITLEIDVSGADQGETAFVGNGENDPPIGILEDIGPIVVNSWRTMM